MKLSLSTAFSLLIILAVSSAALNTGQAAAAAPENNQDEINQEDPAEKAEDMDRARTTGDRSPHRLIVVYATESDVRAPVRDAARRESGARLLTASQALRRDVLRVQGGDAEAVAARIRRLPGVLAAYPDSLVHTSAETTPWGLTKIGAPTAWPTSQGAGIKVAVLDCGVHKNHADIGAAKVTLEIDYTFSPYGADDRCGHGTHVAGTIAAVTNNGIGVSSAAPAASFLNGKVLSDSGSGWFSDVESGIKWAADNGAKVINMSLGAFAACPASTAVATNYAWGKGAVIIVAAGNDGRQGESAPANCPNAVGVAATDSNDVKAYFSNYGTNVELAAPGVSVLSTINPDINGGAEYASYSGTSMATPHVSGVAALVWATSYGTSATAVRQRLYDTADKISGTGTSWQYGRVSAAKAVAPSTPDFSLSVAPSSVSVTAGSSAAYTVNINRVGGFAGAVSGSISNLPTGASGGFSPNPASGNSSSLTVATSATTLPGTYVFTVTGTSDLLTHTATATLVVVSGSAALPAISINDASRYERNSGTRNLNFTVSLAASSTQTVTVNYATANGTTNAATGGTSCGGSLGVDYLSKAGSLSFSPGQTLITLSVTTCADTVVEPNETLFVNLSGATNATIADGQGVGTILNDD